MEILLNLAVEDEPSEFLLRVVLNQSKKDYLVGDVYGKRGSGYLKKNLSAFNNASKGSAHLVLTDLDQIVCAPTLIEDWFGCAIQEYHKRCNRNLMFKVAIREIEAWILADRLAFSKFVGVRVDRIPLDTDSIENPKEFLVELAKGSRFRNIREDLAPRVGDIRRIGPNYNPRLSEFIRDSWRASEARVHSPSLARLIDALDSFHPLLRSN